jgi:uncharacterized protein
MMTRIQQLVPSAVVLAVALAAASPVLAQSKKELAAKIVQLQQPAVDNVARGIAAQTAQQMLQFAGQAMGAVPPEKREAVGKDIQADVKKFHDEVEVLLRDRATKLAPSTLGPMMEEKFSEDELKQVLTWLESPAAKKYQQMANDLQSAIAAKVVADTRPAVEPKLKALQASLQKKLGLPPASAPAAAPSASAPAKAASPAKK